MEGDVQLDIRYKVGTGASSDRIKRGDDKASLGSGGETNVRGNKRKPCMVEIKTEKQRG